VKPQQSVAQARVPHSGGRGNLGGLKNWHGMLLPLRGGAPARPRVAALQEK